MCIPTGGKMVFPMCYGITVGAMFTMTQKIANAPPFCIILESLIIQWKQLEGPGDYSEMSYSEQTYPAWNHGISSALIIKKHMDEHRGGKKQNILSAVKMSASMSFQHCPNDETQIFTQRAL